MTGLRKPPQRRDGALGGVVQVRHARNGVGIVLQRWQEVQQVFAVAADLLDRMKHRVVAVALDRHQSRVVLVDAALLHCLSSTST